MPTHASRTLFRHAEPVTSDFRIQAKVAHLQLENYTWRTSPMQAGQEDAAVAHLKEHLSGRVQRGRDTCAGCGQTQGSQPSFTPLYRSTDPSTDFVYAVTRSTLNCYGSVCARGRHTSFGAMSAMSKGEVGTRTQIGYNFIVRKTGGRTGQGDEGGVGGSSVFVQATRRVEREQEFFAIYGDSFHFPHGCQCHLCAAQAVV